MELPKGYYAFAAVSELSSKRPNALRRLGLDWVVWQGLNQEWVAQSDRCPHRSAQLSAGDLIDGCVRCPFHGFRFDSEGNCTFVPEINRAAPGLSLKSYPLILKNDFLWLAWRIEAKSEVPWFNELNDQSFTYSQGKSHWKTHFSRCVENQLDYAHLPFVHANSIGKNFDPTRKMTYEIGNAGMRVYLGEKGPHTGFFEFLYPNIWQLHISSKMIQTLFFVPVDDSSTLIYARAYHRFTRIPVLREFIAWASKLANPYILAQDQRVVMTQKPQDVRSITAAEEHLFPSDRAIVAFRSWLKEER